MNNLLLAGNHRGATCIALELTPGVVSQYEPEWILADPKPGRAENLGTQLRRRFASLRPNPLCMTAKNALTHVDQNDTLVLALDTLGDTRETLQARTRTQRATFQIVGRGPGPEAVMIGIQGTLVPGDSKSERSVLMLLEEQERMTRDASSRILTEADPLTASVLQPMREVVARQTVRHLAEQDRTEPWDLSGGPLSITFGATSCPLIAVRGQLGDRYSHQKEIALNACQGIPPKAASESGQPRIVVALVIPEEPTILFLTVVRETGKPYVDGLTKFQRYKEPAVFTD